MRKHFHAPMSRGLLAVALLLCVVLTGCNEVVSRQEHESETARLRAEIADVRTQLKKTEEARDGYLERLNTVENQRKEFLMAQVRTLKEDVKKAEKRTVQMEQVGYDRGALAVYKSVNMVGKPFVVRGIIWDDWYYDFTVQINGHDVGNYRIPTNQQCSPFVEGLTTVTSVASLLK